MWAATLSSLFCFLPSLRNIKYCEYWEKRNWQKMFSLLPFCNGALFLRATLVFVGTVAKFHLQLVRRPRSFSFENILNNALQLIELISILVCSFPLNLRYYILIYCQNALVVKHRVCVTYWNPWRYVLGAQLIDNSG